MLATLRKTLIDSHVAAITVAWMLFSAVELICQAADQILRCLILFIQLFLSHRLRHFSSELAGQDPSMPLITVLCLTGAAAAILCAWLVSRWVYGMGPLRSLGQYREKLSRNLHA